MSGQPPNDRDPITLASLYAAGAITDDERAQFEACLAAGDETCIAELEALGPVIDMLGSNAPPVAPSSSVKDSLMARIDADMDLAKSKLPCDVDVFNLQANEGNWQETGAKGVRIRSLFIDREINRQTFLVRMDPGTSFPSHPHSGVEECYVIEGDLYSAGRWMQAGDYQRAPAGSQHGETRTRNGCLCLVTAAAA